MDEGADEQGDAVARLGEGLRDAFARLAAAPLDAEEKARLHGRLIAITNVAKHDAERAEAKVRAFLAELDAAGGDAEAEADA